MRGKAGKWISTSLWRLMDGCQFRWAHDGSHKLRM
ncbi:hypothetical protein L915_01888 [Phytophthora nicotianae]|uniref:Uncharacterized protein n=1 Tax=Phytophthora nicotianae TaxID=4792 RepID=W2HIP5_PHYNI|nr:hypothetical protein L915_01888 [Phytophthora nicotianae]